MASNFKTLWIGFVFMLGGCALGPAQMQVLDKAAVCCSTYSEMRVSGRLGQEPITFEITTDSPSFEFDMGKSFFQLMELASPADNAELEVRTFFTGAIAPTAHYFFPVMTFLDDSYKPILVAEPEIWRPHLFGPTGTSTWFGRVQIPKGAIYSVFHTPRERIGSSYSGPIMTKGMTMMIGLTVLSLPGGPATATGKLGPTGKIMAAVKLPGT